MRSNKSAFVIIPAPNRWSTFKNSAWGVCRLDPGGLSGKSSLRFKWNLAFSKNAASLVVGCTRGSGIALGRPFFAAACAGDGVFLWKKKGKKKKKYHFDVLCQ